MARSVETIFTAKVDGYLAGVTRMKTATTDMAKSGASSMKAHGADWDKIGTAATAGGLAITAALGLAGKAAIDWESSWAGVTKTVDGSTQEMAALEEGLRGLATTLPSTHSEIAAVAEAAGQLGVAQGDILGFTETMINLSETTNLTADEAATSIAQISNVMGTLDREGAKGVERFSSALVLLGNNGASTEKDILNMASRIAGAAKVVGMTEADLLAVSNALASVGIEAEAGGTAVSKVLMDMSKAISTGSDDLEKFARVAGVSAEEFARVFSQSPAKALDMFAQGLGRIKAEGGDVFTTLDNLGQSDVRVSGALLKMAGAGDLLSQSLADGARAWEENTALQDEAAKRYETNAAKIQVAKNKVTESMIDLGGAIAPLVTEAAEAVGSLAQAFSDLDPATQGNIAKLAAVAAAALLVGGGAIKATTSILAMKASMDAAGISGARLAVVLKGLGAAAAVGALAAVTNEFHMMRTRAAVADVAVKDLAKSLSDLADTGKVGSGLNSLFAEKGGLFGSDEKIVTTTEAIERFAYTAQDALGDDLYSKIVRLQDMGEGTARLGEYVGQMDAAFAEMVRAGNADKAAASLKMFLDGISDPAVRDEVLAQFTSYQAALDESAIAATNAAGGMEEIGSAAQAAEVSVSELADTIRGFGSAAMSADEAESAFQESLDATRESADEHRGALEMTKGVLDLSTKGAREAAGSLRTLATDTKGASASIIEMGGSQEDAAAKMARGRAEFIKNATQMGLTKKEAERLADAYGLIPEDVKTEVSAPGAVNARQQTQAFIDRIKAIPQSKTAKIAAQTSGIGSLEYMKRLVDSMNSKSVTVRYTTVRRTIGGSTIDGADGHVLLNTGAGLVRSYAGGGFWDGTLGAAQPHIRPAGGQGVRWAEEGAGPWEAFISGHPAKKVRSRGIAEDTVDRLGGTITWIKPMADGGTMTRSMADQVRGLAPRSVGMGGTSVTNLVNVTITDALDPVAVGAQVERALQDYTSVTGRPLQVVTR